jgi:cyclopropane fatty-acyl-phospholipid synthase-like methyltransferase
MTARSLGKWKLPQPTDIKDEEGKEWSKIPRISRIIPFGYEKNEEDSDILNPIPYELEAIEMARKYVKQYSFRQVANWVTKKTGREISHVGLRKRLMHEQQRKNQARTLRKWSEYAQKAIEKAKAIEEERTGSRV